MDTKETQAEIEVLIGIDRSWRWDKNKFGSLTNDGWSTALHQLRHEILAIEQRLEKAKSLIAKVRDIVREEREHTQ